MTILLLGRVLLTEPYSPITGEFDGVGFENEVQRVFSFSPSEVVKRNDPIELDDRYEWHYRRLCIAMIKSTGRYYLKWAGT